MYLFWTDARKGFGLLELFYMVSDDFGMTWGTEYKLTESVEAARSPYVHVADGIIHLSWMDWRTGNLTSCGGTGDIMYMRYPDFDALPPSVKTLNPAGVTGLEATLRGELTGLGNYTLSNVFFDWRKLGSAEWTRARVGKLYSPGQFETTISGLNLSTTYAFRAGASTELEVFGATLEFTTWPNEGPPAPPSMSRAELTGPTYSDVTITWLPSVDEGGGASDVVHYQVRRSDDIRGPYVAVANVTATRSAAYSWTDPGTGHGDPRNLFYQVIANDSYFDSPPSRLAAKFQREVDAGSQLVSIPLVQADDDPSAVLKTLSFDSVRAYSPDDAQDPWLSFAPGRPFNDLNRLDNGAGYWIHVVSPGTMTLAGLVPESTAVRLKAGWNLVGFPSFNETYTFADFDAQVGGIRAIEVYDGGAASYHLKRLDRSAWAITLMQPGMAYWILVSSDQDWAIAGD